MYSQNPTLLWRDIILLAFLYFVAVRIGQLFAIPPGNVTPIWIPSGIIVVAMIYRGFRLWPGIFIGAFAGNIWAYFTTETETSLFHSLIAGFFNGAGDTLGAVLGAYLILLKCNTPYPLKRAVHFLYFILFGAFLSSLVSAAFGVTALWANGFVSDDQYKNVFLTWLTGDAVGVLILTPLLLSFIYAHRKLVNFVEISLYFVLLTVISLYALGILAESPNNTLLFALMPFTLWAVFRFDQRFVFASILIISVNSIATMTFNIGWFSLIEENARLTELQQFVSIFSISVILLSILKAEADDAEAKLRDANNTLDIEVKKRTFKLKQSNLQLQQREAQYSSLFENMLNGVALHKVILDKDGEPVDLEYVAVNPVFEVHSGLKRNEVIGKRVTEVIPEINKGELDLIKNYGEVAVTGKSKKFEFFFPPLKKWFSISAYSPRINFVATISEDITERKLSLDKLERSQRLLKDSQAIASIGSFEHHIKDDIVFWTEALYHVLGCDPETPPPKFEDFIETRVFPEDRQRMYQCIEDAFTNKDTTPSFDYRIWMPDGSTKYIRDRAHVICDEQGNPEWIRGTAQDITEETKISNELQESERRYRTLIDNLPGMVYCCEYTPKFLLQFVSDGCEALIGYTPSELTGESAIDFRDIIHPSDQKRIWETTQLAIGQNQSFEYEYRLRKKDGSERWVWEQGRSISMDNGGPLLLEGYVTDITDKKLAQEALTKSEMQLRATFEQAAVGIARVTTDGRWLDVNEKLCHIVGYTREELLSRTVQDVTYSQDLDVELALVEETLSGKRSAYTLDKRYIKKSGDCVWIRLTVSLVRADDNTPLYFISIIEDINARKKADEKLREAATVFRSTGEGVMITDTKATILDVNDAFTRITGYSREEVIGQNSRVLKSGRHDKAFYQDMWGQLTEQGQWHGEIWNCAKNGSVYPERLTISSVKSEEGKLEGYVGVFADISSLKATEDRLNHLAHHDPLTDLPNRLLFRDRLAHALLTAKRRDTKVAVVFLDLDRFKNINDTLGHGIGDGLLIEVAKRIKKITRLEDTFGRMSGDEFCLILEDISSMRESTTTVRRLSSVFNDSFKVNSKNMRVTASIGIAIYPDNSDDPDALLSFADAAMYEAKESGRNTYRYYSKEMTEQALVNRFVQSVLQDALKESQFFLVYQPQVDLATQSLIGLETLVRWEHPERGLIPPGSFIPIAENSGLIRELVVWILRSACTQARLWLDQGREYGRMFVNVAGPQLYEADFSQVVIDCLNDSRLPAEKLGLEVTEGFVMRATEHAVNVLSQLKNMGIEIAIDDFGTGYSSLSYLKQLPIDKLKIDQSFVRDIPDDKDDMAISAAVIAMGQALRMKVIAEGVENVDQAKILASQGCHQAQGCLFSRPLKPQELEHWMGQSPTLNLVSD